ncbi:hypothetical protein [Streptomyces xantholiticus]|uniref:hypothetical protein n=1 Tax=Streptomyces xantholiticus TaxID=68285 RepID=UPI00167A4886|nr:hypothetical protein [Streptomyces xantholiticus]GGW25505.1 hypothetical protein GCM10010381_06480 [Streptomyces xantholiticus]
MARRAEPVDRETAQGGHVSGPWSVRFFETSSAKVVARTQWSRFSMVHRERTIIGETLGGRLAAGEVGQH